MMATEEGMNGGPRKVKVKKGSIEEKFFAGSRMDELRGFMRDGTFLEVREADLIGSPRVFGSRFVDERKKFGSDLKRKSRLVAQNYNEEGATSIATKAPTDQRFSQRVALSIAASSHGMTSYTRDVTQAYIQSHTPLERDVYTRVSRELNLQAGSVLKVVKPVYGIPESGLHWYLTYFAHYLEV